MDEIVRDTAPPLGAAIVEQRLDETEIGRAKFVTLTEVQPESGVIAAALPDRLSVDRLRVDLIGYDVFASIYNTGKHALVASWRDRPSAERFSPPASAGPPPSSRARRSRLRHVRSPRGAVRIVEAD